jgi:hypothetical protein
MESGVPAGATPVSLARQQHRKNRWVSGDRYAELAEYLTRRGKPVASLSPIRPAPRGPDWTAIRAFRESLPTGGSTATELVRASRESRF